MCVAVLGLLGTAVSAMGSIAQGNQQNALAKAQAAALDQQAEAQRRSDAFESMKDQRQSSLMQSAARAQVGASGVGFQGSPTAVLTANAGQAQLDLEAIQFGSIIKQNNLRTQADISRMQGKAAKQAGMINAASGLISGVSQMYQPSKSARLGQSQFA